MKISQEEIEKAFTAFLKTPSPGKLRASKIAIEAAIEAALTVRRARKAAKRERQRKEKDKQVVESVKPAGKFTDALNAYMSIAASVGKYGSVEPTPSKAPEWAVSKAQEVWNHIRFPAHLGDGQYIHSIARIISEALPPSKAPEWDGNASAFDAAMKPKA